ncbi:hypothetical protein V3N99_21300 [Dermatophilaceae bacterium Soc4.6]
MTTYELTRDQGSVTLSSDRIMVHLDLPTTGWHLEVRTVPSSAAFPAPRLLGGQWLLQNPAAYAIDRASLHVVSDGVPFAAGVECRPTLDVGATGAGPAVRLPAVDLSGIRSAILVTLAVDGGGPHPQLTVALPEGQVAPTDPSLSAAARHALAEVRSRLDSQVVDASENLNLTVCVDASASMLPVAQGGDLEALVNALHGMSHVLSWGKSFRVGLVDLDVTWLGSGAPGSSPGAAVAQELLARPAFIGGRLGHEQLVANSVVDNTMTYVVTDSVPADAEQIARSGEVEGEARHLVLMSAGHDDEALTAALGMPVSVWRPGLGPDDADYRKTIYGLLRSCFDPRSDYAKRLLT